MSYRGYNYVPILRVMNAEMRGLEELSGSCKDKILPYIILRPWTTSRSFDRTIARVDSAFGARKIIADITDEDLSGRSHQVHDKIRELCNPADGYKNWCSFIEENENYIPAVQLTDPVQLEAQIQRLAAIGRGGVIRLNSTQFGFAKGIAERVVDLCNPEDALFIFDFERQNRELLGKASAALGLVDTVRGVIPGVSVAVAASSFPDSFVGVDRQEIFERSFFNAIDPHIGSDRHVYCDRGSARVGDLQSYGQPTPRVDLALASEWVFHRNTAGYQEAADDARNSASFVNLGIWGTNQIIEAAHGTGGIRSSVTSVAARINIHLTQQAFYGEPTGGEEEAWAD